MATGGQAQIEAHLKKILASARFRNTRRLKELLLHIVTETIADRRLGEQSIGVAVWGLPPNFQANENDIVRGAILRLRKTLDAYYHDEGKGDDVIIRVPTYKAAFEFRDRSVEHVAREVERHDRDVIVSLPGSLYAINIDGSYEALEQIWHLIQPILQTHSRDTKASFVFGRPNASVIIYFLCSPTGYAHIINAWNDGSLAASFGFPITQIGIAEEIETPLRSTYSKALEAFVGTPIDVQHYFPIDIWEGDDGTYSSKTSALEPDVEIIVITKAVRHYDPLDALNLFVNISPDSMGWRHFVRLSWNLKDLNPVHSCILPLESDFFLRSDAAYVQCNAYVENNEESSTYLHPITLSVLNRLHPDGQRLSSLQPLILAVIVEEIDREPATSVRGS